MNKGLNLLVLFITSCLLQDWKLLPDSLGLGCLFHFHFLVLVFCGIYWIVITGFYLRENNWLLHPSFVFAVNKLFGQVDSSWSWSRNQPESSLYWVRAHSGIVSFQVVLRWYTAIIPVPRISVLAFGWALVSLSVQLYCCCGMDSASTEATVL